MPHTYFLPSRWLLTLLLVGLLPPGLWAQPSGPDRLPAVPARADSLRAWLRRPGLPDSTRAKLLIRGSMLHMGTRLDSAQWYAEQAVALARRSRFAWGETVALNHLAASHYYTSDYPAAQRAFEQVLRQAQAQQLTKLTGHAYLGLGNVATALQNAPAAQAYFTRAQRAYAACQPRFVDGELLVLYNRANGYLDARQYKPARQLAQQVLTLLRRYPGSGRLGKALSLLGNVQQAQGQPDSAAATFRRAIRSSQAEQDVNAEAECWLNLATLAQQQRHYPTALRHVRRAAFLSRSLGDLYVLAQALELQARTLAALRRPEAYDTLRRYATLRDTLLSQQRMEAVANAQARFGQAEQRARIRVLEQQQRIAELENQQRIVRTRLLVGGLAAALLLLLGAGWWAYRRRQQRREAALRRQLAADLHDDVGGLLSRIALQTDLMQEGLGAPGLQHAQLAEVAGNSRLAVRQLNDVVWSLDARNDSVPNLLDRLRDYAHEVLVPTGRDVRFVADDALGSSPSLSAPLRRGLYLIYKEALHNILKYAPTDATVTVRLHRTTDALHLDVVNSGPPAELTRGSGHGLRNMRERAAALGGSTEAGPEPAGGFAVRVRVPV